MEWQVIVVLAVVIPVILFPAAFIWYINVGGVYAAIREAKEKRVAEKKGLNKPVKVTNT